MQAIAMSSNIQQQIIGYVVLAIVLIIVIVIAYFAISYWWNSSPLSQLFNNAASGLSTAVSAIAGGVGRGVGVPIHTCPDGDDQQAGLCYKPCSQADGAASDLSANSNLRLDGVGPVCWSACPSGYTDFGVGCSKPASYGRGAGRIPDVSCPSGYYQLGLGTASWCQKNFPGIGTTSSSSSCHSDEEMYGGLCYPKCKSGFHTVGCCVCSPDCPTNGFVDSGVSCTKKSYPRGAGVPLTCADNEDYDGGLCYQKCSDVPDVQSNPNISYKGIGPMCWPQ